MGFSQQKWSKEMFLKERENTLSQWATGKEVCFEESVRFHAKLPQTKNVAYVLGQAHNRPLIQPRGGRALIEQQLALMKYLSKEGDADLLTITIDSLTREQKYAAIQQELEKCRLTGKDSLNGWPIVNYGVDGCRRLANVLTKPIQVRHAAVDGRLLSEIAVAGGISSLEGGGISANIPYLRDYDPEHSLKHWQYVDRLLGEYQEEGICINREPFGALTGTLVPPCISHVVGIIETVLAALQGVTSVTVSYGQCGNLIQDVAAIQTLPFLVDKYLTRFGLSGVQVTTAFHQWMGGFPNDANRAYGIIGWAAATAAFSGASKVLVKNPHEALNQPNEETIRAGLETTLQVLNMVSQQPLPHNAVLEQEKQLIIMETEAILESVIELGGGDIAKGSIEALKTGIIDVPFAPSRYNAGKVLPARDLTGAVRFLDWGRLPFSKDIEEFHKGKINERGQAEHQTPSFQMVINDISAISKGMLLGKAGY